MTTLVIGGGWLGLPLACALANSQDVIVTHTSTHKANATQQAFPQLTAIEFNINQSLSTNQLAELCSKYGVKVIIGAFPPGLRKKPVQDYVGMWRYVAQQAKLANVETLLMVSTTGVYPSRQGQMVENDASLSLAKSSADFSDKSSVLLDAEQQVIGSGVPYFIARLSGLVGPNRDPANFASRLKSVSDQAPTNMVHQSDVIRAITHILTLEKNEVFNVTTPNTVSKAEFYQAALDKRGESLSEDVLTSVPDKEICADKLSKTGFKFQHQHVLDLI